MPSEGKCDVNVWFIKPEGLYDTYEPLDDVSEWFEDEEESWEWKLGSYRGWQFRSAR
jgi:hypothetical protein